MRQTLFARGVLRLFDLSPGEMGGAGVRALKVIYGLIDSRDRWDAQARRMGSSLRDETSFEIPDPASKSIAGSSVQRAFFSFSSSSFSSSSLILRALSRSVSRCSGVATELAARRSYSLITKSRTPCVTLTIQFSGNSESTAFV